MEICASLARGPSSELVIAMIVARVLRNFAIKLIISTLRPLREIKTIAESGKTTEKSSSSAASIK